MELPRVLLIRIRSRTGAGYSDSPAAAVKTRPISPKNAAVFRILRQFGEKTLAFIGKWQPRRGPANPSLLERKRRLYNGRRKSASITAFRTSKIPEQSPLNYLLISQIGSNLLQNPRICVALVQTMQRYTTRRLVLAQPTNR